MAVTPKAPPLADGDWLTAPPTVDAHLAGRVSIIVFWSIGNEASWVRLRQLEDLSSDLDDTLAIIAVHSPRHPSESDRTAVEQLITRAKLPFPVLHDPDLSTWARFNPLGWPATVVIDHRGRLMGISHGIDDLDVLFEAVGLAESLARAKRAEAGVERLRPVPTPTPNRRSSDRGFAWPGGLCVTADGRVAVVDSGNDRVVVLELDAERRRARVRQVLGGLDRPSQVCELADGGFAVTEPANGRVMQVHRDEEPSILADGFVRPRGIAVDLDGSLVVADAGADKLYRVFAGGAKGAIAGTGLTGCADGRAGAAELAQPIAVARTAGGIAFLDAASSSLRLLTDSGTVRTAIGGNLDRAGLIDGAAESAALDRPMDLAILESGSVAIVDTGNHRLRLLVDRRLETLGVAGLDSPEAVAELAPGLLLVADTGNHRLVVVEPAAHRVWELEVDEPERDTSARRLRAVPAPTPRRRPS